VFYNDDMLLGICYKTEKAQLLIFLVLHATIRDSLFFRVSSWVNCHYYKIVHTHIPVHGTRIVCLVLTDPRVIRILWSVACCWMDSGTDWTRQQRWYSGKEI